MIHLNEVTLSVYKDLRANHFQNTDYQIIKSINIYKNESFKVDHKIESKQNYYFIIVNKMESSSTIIGSLSLSLKENDLRIRDIEILETYRNKGYGTNILQYIVETASLEGLKQISLVVFNHRNQANYIYSKLGFQQEKKFNNSVKLVLQLG